MLNKINLKIKIAIYSITIIKWITIIKNLHCFLRLFFIFILLQSIFLHKVSIWSNNVLNHSVYFIFIGLELIDQSSSLSSFLFPPVSLPGNSMKYVINSILNRTKLKIRLQKWIKSLSKSWCIKKSILHKIGYSDFSSYYQTCTLTYQQCSDST